MRIWELNITREAEYEYPRKALNKSIEALEKRIKWLVIDNKIIY